MIGSRSCCEALRDHVLADPLIAHLDGDDLSAVQFHMQTFEERFRREDWDGCMLAIRHIDEVKQAILCRPSPNQQELFA